MSKDKNHSAPLTELSAERMQAYLDNTLSNSDRHAVERYLLDHPFEAEAMQGYEHVSIDMKQDLSILSQRIDDVLEQKGRKVIPLWKRSIAIAAAITVLLVGSFAIFELFDVTKQNGQIGMNEPVEKVEEIKEANPTKATPEDSETVVEKQEEHAVSPKPTESPRKKTPKKVVEHVAKEERKENDEDMVAIEMDYVADYATPEQQDTQENVVTEIESTTELNESYASGSALRSAPSAKMKKSSAKLERSSISDPKMVKGLVVDSEMEPIAGATVIVKQTGEAAITDLNGEFQIPVHSEDDMLSVSFIGFNTQDIVVGEQDSIRATMSLDMASLDEVVVVGYGTEQPASSSATPDGGYRAFKQYLKDDLVYPRWAKAQKIEGKVTLRFRVKTNGELADFEILEGLGYGCDEEAIRLIEEGPDWTPARENGSPKESVVNVKVRFEL
ncbi:TonB family protein [Reichenbachiella agarivorans]|uniref:TonB family protein n=1 Tax=Reichenbachiella agarivorans TaxID=2979464 RepID=A0ABY6CVG2_9BACT|nr:TonB family protein [Reichenbachiella agarivorans]UXP33388.1 TonB family protein [Reichenbachiella agarivorans]